jgi:LDH2 family malate/lactate/ureidoglycolate dehydrogenase
MVVNSIRAVLLASNDNVAAAIAAVDAAVHVVVTLNSSDETVLTVCSRQKVPFGHKIAIKDVAKGSPIVRYGYPIGVATADIKLGDHVHSHNMRSALSPASAEKAPAREIRPADWVRRKTAEVLLSAGASADAAGAMASAISEAHLRGVETHGLRRLRPYLARIRAGGVDPKAQPTKEQHGGLLMIDGRNAIGHYVAAEAAKAVSDAARQFGVAIAIVRNSNHFGFAGYYATLIAQRGQIGIVTSNGQVCVGPKGARKALLSNNPLAIAAPTGRDDAFLEMDLATSVTSRANVVEFAKSGQSLQAHMAQDAAGHPTRDPAAALEGSLLAFGGDKGFALLVALEAMTGVLAGGAYADQVSSKEAAPSAPEGTAHSMIAIDISKAIGESNYAQRLDDMLGRLRALPAAEDAEKIRYPGERRWQLRRERLKVGIPLSKNDLEALLEAAREADVSTA